MSTFDVWSVRSLWSLHQLCSFFIEPECICLLSKGKTLSHHIVTPGVALCWSLTAHTQTLQTHPETRNSWRTLGLESYNSPRCQKRRCHCLFFLYGSSTTLVCQQCHIKCWGSHHSPCGLMDGEIDVLTDDYIGSRDKISVILYSWKMKQRERGSSSQRASS